MKHNIKTNCISYKDGAEVLNIIVKIDFIELIKIIAEKRSNQEYRNVNLSIIIKMPRKLKTERKIISNKPLEKKLLNEYDLSVAASHRIHAVAGNLTTLRSNVVRFYNNIITNVKYKDKERGDCKGRKEKEWIELEISNDSFKQSKKAKKYLKSRNIGIEKSKQIFNKPMNKWNAIIFLQYMKYKFKKSYGQDSFELNKAMNTRMKRGQLVTIIFNRLIKGFKKAGYTKTHIRNYIDWVYDIKATKIKFAVSFWFLVSDTLITEWIMSMSKNFNKGESTMKDLMQETKRGK